MHLLLSKESVSWGEGSTDLDCPPLLCSAPRFLPSNCSASGNLLSFSEYSFFKNLYNMEITFITEVLQASKQIVFLKHNPQYLRERQWMETVAIIFIISVFIMTCPLIVLTNNRKLLHEQLYTASAVTLQEKRVSQQLHNNE